MKQGIVYFGNHLPEPERLDLGARKKTMETGVAFIRPIPGLRITHELAMSSAAFVEIMSDETEQQLRTILSMMKPEAELSIDDPTKQPFHAATQTAEIV